VHRYRGDFLRLELHDCAYSAHLRTNRLRRPALAPLARERVVPFAPDLCCARACRHLSAHLRPSRRRRFPRFPSRAVRERARVAQRHQRKVPRACSTGQTQTARLARRVGEQALGNPVGVGKGQIIFVSDRGGISMSYLSNIRHRGAHCFHNYSTTRRLRCSPPHPGREQVVVLIPEAGE
jgi:hypothetical protein